MSSFFIGDIGDHDLTWSMLQSLRHLVLFWLPVLLVLSPLSYPIRIQPDPMLSEVSCRVSEE